MARAPGEAGRDDASDAENDLLELLDETRTNQRLQRFAIFLGLLSIALGLLSIAASLVFDHLRELILPFLVSILAVLAITTLVFNHRPERPPGVGTEPDKADEAARSAQADPSASLLDRAVSVAIRLQRQGNIEKALEKWRAIANVADGTDAELGARAWFSVGYLHWKESRHQEAIDAYDEATRLKPDMAEAYNDRGVAKNKLGRHEDAIADYDEAIRLKPDYAEAYGNRGNAKSRLGRYEDAIADYDEATQLKPDMADTYYNRGNAKSCLGRHEDAIADYDEAIRLKPDYANAYNNRGGARFALGHKDEARRDFERERALALAAGDEAMADRVSREIERLFGGGDP